MGLADIVRSGVATINKVTDSLQGQVTIKPWVAQDVNGTPTYGAIKKVKAIIELGEKSLKTSSGVSVDIQAKITFLKPIKANGAAGRVEPIDDRDVITLPDGTTGPTIVGEPMIVDPASSKPYFQIVGIGS